LIEGIPKYLEIEDVYVVEISVAFVLLGPLTGKFSPLAGNFELYHILQLLCK
jgi:hypothetical protein